MDSKANFKQHGQVGHIPVRGPLRGSTMRGAMPAVMQGLQALAFAAAIVLLFAGANWLDQYSEDQHRQAHAQRRQVIESAYLLGVARGRAEMAATQPLHCDKGL